jgi:uncharacterized membrane protein YbhN (UPF0104 family)
MPAAPLVQLFRTGPYSKGAGECSLWRSVWQAAGRPGAKPPASIGPVFAIFEGRAAERLAAIRWLRVLSGVALLALLLFLADPGRLLDTLRSGDPLPAAAAAVPFAATILLEAWRIALLFEPYELGYGTALRVTLVSLFFASLTPGALGGEVYKVYFARGRKPGLARPIALTILLRLTGVCATLSLAVLYLAAYPERIEKGFQQARWSGPSRPVLGAAALLLAAGLGLALASPRGRALGRRAWAALTEALRSLHQVRPPRLAGLALISLVIAVTRVVYFYLLARSFAPDLFLPDLAPVAAATVVAGAVPVTLGGLGTQEGVLAAGLVLFGLPYPAAVAASLLNRGFLWTAAAAGWTTMVKRPPAA